MKKRGMAATYKSGNCIIVLGIGGKPEELLNLQLVQQDAPLLVKRFTGGGTVVLTQDSLLTTIIGRTHLTPELEPFPRSIMDFTASAIFKPTFHYMERQIAEQSRSPKPIQPLKSLVVEPKSCGVSSISAKSLRFPSLNSTTSRTMKSHQQDPCTPKFALQENDYVLGAHKIAGNAQSIIKGAWLHHTSFLWDFGEEMDYLQLPKKRPNYRQDRSHKDFLTKLNTFFGDNHDIFFDGMKNSVADYFELEEVTLQDALQVVDTQSSGGMQQWFEQCKTTFLNVS